VNEKVHGISARQNSSVMFVLCSCWLKYIC